MHQFVKYAVKLGYSTNNAELALTRLGEEASTKDLLSLVISIQSATSARLNDLPGKKKVVKKPRRRCLGYKLESLSYVAVPDSTS